MQTTSGALPEWARAYGAPLFAATIRKRPSDFLVIEKLGFEPAGLGEHDYLWVEKTGSNTEWVARQLARHAGARPADVGFSGMKDRHAITRQWFSVPRRGSVDWSTLAVEGVSILDVTSHRRKLRRGAHKSNAFRIALRSREVPALRPLVDERLTCIAARGVPNYFGPQRFGHHGANVDLARALFSGKRLKRDKRSIAISAARSFLFNQILSARVVDGSWERILPGETVNLDGSGSVFHAETVDETIERRAASMDIHPTGTLWGLRSEISHGVVESLERNVTEAEDDLRAGLECLAVKASSRPLRLPVRDLSWEFDDDALWLEFLLPAGGFATSVLREVASLQDRFSSRDRRQGAL